MVGWQQMGAPGTISFTPELWRRWMLANFGLNYDPSHMLIQGLTIAPIYEFKDRIFHAQAVKSSRQIADMGFVTSSLKE